ncbi:MAG: iron-sulfur cluster assembly scaffold protein [Thermodesulfobacteriota bacterium]
MSDEPELTPGQVGVGFLRHAQAPRNLGEMAQPSGRGRAVGVCGDAIQVDLGVHDEVITEVRVMPQGCVYTTVCASAVGELALGLRLDQALELTPDEVEKALGGLPEDHLHCARLAVNTLGEAIADYYARATLAGRRPAAEAERS